MGGNARVRPEKKKTQNPAPLIPPRLLAERRASAGPYRRSATGKTFSTTLERSGCNCVRPRAEHRESQNSQDAARSIYVL